MRFFLFPRLVVIAALSALTVLPVTAADKVAEKVTDTAAKAAPVTKTVPTPPNMLELYRFSDADAVARWSATDDRVMGGISQSRLRFDPAGFALFEGVMSLEQNGGFASVRAAAAGPPLPGITHYVVEVRGDGKRYKLDLRTSGRFSAASYQASFATVADNWTTVALPVNSFAPSFRGRRVIDAPPLDAALVNQVGLMIADSQDGPFQLAIRRIAVEAR
jgi:NADH dehydrogenase [ubiquinone] 1 alpha subcomplex assembly factor 1